ncbi:hypothetical protein CBR_g34505 [Chara braunii]|uniref:carbonic anhydrase n=1 Tax=Chara braunii TaxID=69332 RepID=A0A388LIZ3_CHABU|nr:hypothetical protein CBR_g34505 [Chara braunii]|eukprot:GBG82221.1 hypothetical protein CBR_g34505 [Chara braunii]
MRSAMGRQSSSSFSSASSSSSSSSYYFSSSFISWRESLIFLVVLMLGLMCCPPLVLSSSDDLTGGTSASGSRDLHFGDHDLPSYDYGKHGHDWPGVCTDPKSRFQSPLDVNVWKVARVQDLGDLRPRADYPRVKGEVSLFHNGRTFEMALDGANTMQLPMFDVEPYNFSTSWSAKSYIPQAGGYGGIDVVSRTYYLKQCHFHMHSETAVQGKYFDLQMHCVHALKGPHKAPSHGVWGVFFKRGYYSFWDTCNPVLDRVFAALPALARKKPFEILRLDMRGFSLSQLLPEDGTYLHYYPGSLTTPPCTEGLLWYFFSKPLPICARQVNLISDFIYKLNGQGNMNFRELQPLNDRVVYAWGDPKSGQSRISED